MQVDKLRKSEMMAQGASGGWGRLSMVSENRRGYRKGAPPKVHLQ
jgi:hypothetical protein